MRYRKRCVGVISNQYEVGYKYYMYSDGTMRTRWFGPLRGKITNTRDINIISFIILLILYSVLFYTLCYLFLVNNI